jgi:hypothetical protein
MAVVISGGGDGALAAGQGHHLNGAVAAEGLLLQVGQWVVLVEHHAIG